MLGLHIEIFTFQGAILYKVGKPFHHDRLGRDGIRRHHMGLCLPHGKRHCLIAGNKQLLVHASASFSIEIAPGLQARLQTPHPLQ